MKCEEVEASMIDYLDNVLDENSKEKIEKHLITCEKCMDEVKDFKEMMGEMSASKMEQPDDTLRLNFYHMLQSEINKQQKTNKKTIRSISFWNSPSVKVAAGVALLLTGTFIGKIIPTRTKPDTSNAQLSELKTEVTEMKKILMFTMLNEESASERIKAVNYVEEMPNPDVKVIHVLVSTLNKDKNVNVRLTALYNLARFADKQEVRDSLVRSLEMQTDPILQIALMNILTEKKEKKAVAPMRKIMSEKNAIKEVKETAQKGITVLL